MAEPFFTEIPSGIQMTEAFNWYGENRSWSDSKKYIITYLVEHDRKNLAAHVKSLAEYEISWVCGWICRQISQDSKVPPDAIKYLETWLNEINKS
jgi:hypothetical protein